MTPTPADDDFMREALRLAYENVDAGRGGPFGAVVVKDGKVIGRGTNLVTSTNDPTAHAEVVAIRLACKAENNFSLAGARIYTSCEPCPMCLAAIYWARLDTIYYANTRHDAARIGFDDDHIYREINLSHEQRATPIILHQPKDANDAFALWEKKPDKIPY